ncbi:MAG TPA: HD domain-containing phosphohydrolase [Vicinamibacterales bacterium]
MTVRHFDSLSPAMRAYVGIIVVAGFATIAQSVVDIAHDPHDWEWALLAVLTLLSGSATVRLPSLPATISVSETFVFTSVLLFGPAAGTITVALDAFIISVWAYKKGDPIYKIGFNVCALPLTIWLAGHLFFLTAGIPPLVDSEDSVAIRNLLGPLLLFTIAYFLLNSWIITFAISLEKHLPPVKIWRENFLWLSLNYFGGASVAALLVSYTKNLDFTYLAVIIPLLVVLYFTFSTSMGRVEDANRHLTQLNSLYISTIETLAMAIDAKDQITHGHIRRVQTYAVALAKAMGVSDEKLIRAIEAAALLHDMGKLAVPEYILNKPGPLTPAEFEKMKLHASVGADILSSIDFPYPVVPIVRHHHENWNGTGYPDGIAGPAIPIGARILSVVDCFDALTSDRPYRPRLADREAIRILLERRGTMYDPLVVDTFIQIHPTLVTTTAAGTDVNLRAITGASIPSTHVADRQEGLDDITSSAGEVVALFALSQALSGQLKMVEVAHITFGHLRRLVPHAFGVLFAYIEETDELIAAHASGQSASLLTGMRVPMGQRLTGWVAASRQTIRNSDPVLDLGEAAKTLMPRPRSCLSTPLTLSGRLVGVLTIYSPDVNFFSEEHERIFEAAARQVSPAVNRALKAESGSILAQALSLSPSGEPLPDEVPVGTCLAVVETDDQGPEITPETAEAISTELIYEEGANDLVFQRGGRQLVILSEQRDERELRKLIGRALPSTYRAQVVVARSPAHGRSLEQLIAAADDVLRKMRGSDHPPTRSIH